MPRSDSVLAAVMRKFVLSFNLAILRVVASTAICVRLMYRFAMFLLLLVGKSAIVESITLDLLTGLSKYSFECFLS